MTLYISECLKKLQKVRKRNFCAGGKQAVLRKGFPDTLFPGEQTILLTPVPVVRASNTPRLWMCCIDEFSCSRFVKYLGLILCQLLFIIANPLFAWFFQCNSKGQGEKEMYTLGITNFPIPGEPGFPLNAIYAKPANKQEEGKADQGLWGSHFINCTAGTAVRKMTVKPKSPKPAVCLIRAAQAGFSDLGDSPGSLDKLGKSAQPAGSACRCETPSVL